LPYRLAIPGMETIIPIAKDLDFIRVSAACGSERSGLMKHARCGSRY